VPPDISTRAGAATLQLCPGGFPSSLAPSQREYERARERELERERTQREREEEAALERTGFINNKINKNNKYKGFISPRIANQILHSYSDRLSPSGAGGGGSSGGQRGGRLRLQGEKESTRDWKGKTPHASFSEDFSLHSDSMRAGTMPA
jgi:hypothetical protein